jgi:hypothetical protein
MSVEQITDGVRERREWNARLKLFGTIVNTYGFAALGGSLAEPLLKGQAFTPWNMSGILMGIAAHLVALYLAPVGETHGRGR